MPARKRASASAGKTPGKLSLAAASRLADNILKDLQPLLQEAAARNQAHKRPFQAGSDPETLWIDQPLAIPRIHRLEFRRRTWEHDFAECRSVQSRSEPILSLRSVRSCILGS
jgi:hypothetical protein